MGISIMAFKPVWVTINLLFIVIFSFLPNSAFAERACSWAPGVPQFSPNIEIPSANDIVAINGKHYPQPLNTAFADPTSSRYGSAASLWAMICTAPVEVTPVLYVQRTPDERYTEAGWTHLQNTTEEDYSFEMWYDSPAGQRLWFDGHSGMTKRGAPFILAQNATPTNPVTLHLQDFGIQHIGFQGYQTANAEPGTVHWGASTVLNYISFEMVNYTSRDLNKYNDFNLPLYIDHLTFLVRGCDIVSSDVYKSIPLETISASQFSSANVGATSSSVIFQIGLHCFPDVAVTYHIEPGSRDVAHDPDNNLGLIKLQGNNPDDFVAIQLRALPFAQDTGQFSPVIFGKEVDASSLISSNKSPTKFITLDARYFRTEPTQHIDNRVASTTATLLVNYQ